MIAFKGEQAITSAMMELVEGKKEHHRSYVVGHKRQEPSIAEPPSNPMALEQQQQQSPISVLKTFIENENIKFQELNLFDEPARFRPTIKTMMILGPQHVTFPGFAK